MQSLGTCHWCDLPIPVKTLTGQEAREGIEYKQVMGEPETMWHQSYPDYPDCFHEEGGDPTSVWYDDPWRFLEPDEDMHLFLSNPLYENLEDWEIR